MQRPDPANFANSPCPAATETVQAPCSETAAHTPRFLESELPVLPAQSCRFQVIPVPYEASVSYGHGTADGPAAILAASSQLEVWTGRGNPSAQGIYTWPAVDCSGAAEAVLDNIEAAVTTALAAGPQGFSSSAQGAVGTEKFTPQALNGVTQATLQSSRCAGVAGIPVILGGEHTVTLGVLRALKKRWGSFGIIQFDAHGDLRDSYEGSRYSHACVMRRAVEDLGLPLFQIGVRSLCPEELVVRREKQIAHLDARDAGFPLSRTGAGEPLLPLLPAGFPDKLFLTFDIDALDASLMPATGTPEPGGLFWWDALHLVERSLAGRTTIGFDVVELAPLAQMHAPTYTAARLVYEIMGIIDG